MNYPKIPAHLNTVRSGDVVARWRERRQILIAQRDIRQRWLQRIVELQVEGAPVSRARRQTTQAIDTINGRIQECNEALDALVVTDPAVFVRPRRQIRRRA